MTQPNHIKLPSNNKDTRWDRIRKRYCSSVTTNLKSDSVKRLIEIDYIGKHQQRMLNGDVKLEANLDPVLVMDLRHEMFKEIPRKLPIATIAYSKNLQQCRDHNVSVENHYIENQLNQFRVQLQKQHERNNIPEKKLQTLLIDNTEIIDSLESTHKHMETFYQTPIDALQEVDSLLTGTFEKHREIVDNNLSEEEETLVLEDEYLQNQIYNFNDSDIGEEEQEIGCKELVPYTEGHSNLRQGVEDNVLDFIAEQNNKLNSNTVLSNLQLNSENVGRKSAVPLENDDKALEFLRMGIDDQTSHVRFDDATNVFHFKREASIFSNTSDDIDSVISSLEEEAFKEIQLKEEGPSVETLQKSNLGTSSSKESLTVDRHPSHGSAEGNKDFFVAGKVVPYATPVIKGVAISHIRLPEETVDFCSGTEQSKIINSLFQSRVRDNTSILRKYFLKWLQYSTLEKIHREHIDVGTSRVKKINIFMNKISMEKNRLKNCHQTANESGFGKEHSKNKNNKKGSEDLKINKKYQNRIKAQQDIIDLQRLKLDRQERIIMEFKLHKLSEEARDAREELKSELKAVVSSGDPKSKEKAKCLQIIGNLKDKKEDDSNKVLGKSLLMPKFLHDMQERALERSIRHEQVRQRRLQQEAEKEAQKLALEEAKRLEDEETKRLRIEALKEKRRQEKMAKIIKERERQKYLEKQRKAQDFYKYILLKSIGMEGFKRLLQRKKDIISKCDGLQASMYKRTYFRAWFSLYCINKARRNEKADELYEKILKRRRIQMWRQYIYKEHCKFNIAIDYYDFKLVGIMFQKWCEFVKRMQVIQQIKMKKAILHHEWHSKWKALDCWQRLPQILKLERETEERRQRWRLKIWELLPDYKPNRDNFEGI